MTRLLFALRHKRVSPILNTFFLAIIFNSCKENTILPSDLVPSVDNINTFLDTSLLVQANNKYEDSLLTGGIRNNFRVASNATFFHAIGNLELDPIFGATHAASHLEVVPPSSNFSFRSQLTGTDRTIDSIVLSIPYIRAYGDTTYGSPQNFAVYRSMQRLSRDSAQYEFTEDKFNATDVLATQRVDFRTMATDSPMVGTGKAAPQLRFKLSQNFIDDLEAQVDLGSSGAAASTDAFLNWLNGFYIKPINKDGSALGYFNTYGTRMNIYYRYTTSASKQDTVVDVFGYDPTSCNRYNTIQRNYSNSKLTGFLNTSNPNGDSILFIQNEPGTAVTIAFPDLKNFENVIVNKAELIFTQATPFPFDFNNIYSPMDRMQILLTNKENSSETFVRDYAILGSEFVDGKKRTITIGGKSYTQYKFNLANTFQRVISQKDTTFRLKIMGQNSNTAYPGAFRVVLHGNTSDINALKPRLNLIYTKIK